MKKLLTVILGLGFVVALAACSPAAAAATTAPSSTEGAPAADGTPGPGGFTQSPTTQLLLGTFTLESTSNAVTAEQAGKLLPLWQGLQALSQSDTTAPEELTAVETQLRAGYTADQLTAIEALTPEEIQKAMTDQGLTFGRGGAAPDGTPIAGGNGNGRGGFGGGGPGGGGFGGGGNFDPNNLSPEQQAAIATRQASGGGGFGGRGRAGVPAPLLQAVIDLLTKRAAS